MVNETELGPSPIDIDVLFATLADAHRRRVLAILLDHQKQRVDDLARTLAAADDRPADHHSSSPASNAIERHRLRLHHAYLPRLADAGMVSYDPDRNVVAVTASRASREVVRDLLDGVEQ